MNMSKSIWQAMRDAKAGRRWETIVGYSLQELCAHLESKFLPGMSWSKYGSRWHIDHIKPLAIIMNEQTDESIDERTRRAYALSNLQPLWKEQNLSKGCRYDGV